MRVRPIVFISCLAVLLQTDMSWAREWLVERVSGTAWSIDTAATRTELKAGMEIEEGLTIATARNGRVRLSAENNVMTLGPGSVAAVKPKSFFSSKTEVQQQVGSIEFDIEKRDKPHFTVQTPFMVAVVKGTAFTISVAKSDTRISVNRGLVQVQDLRSGDTAGVAAGQRVSVSTKATGLQTAGPQAPAVSPGRPAAPSVAPVGQTLGSFRASQAVERAQTSVEASTRSFGFAAGTPSAAGDVSRSASSGFGGFGGGLNGSGGDRSATEAAAGVGTASAAAAAGRDARNDDKAASTSSPRDQGTLTSNDPSSTPARDSGTGRPGSVDGGQGRPDGAGSGPGGAGPAASGPGGSGNGNEAGDPGKGGPDRNDDGGGPKGPGGNGGGPGGKGPDGEGPGHGPGKGEPGPGNGKGPDGNGPEGKGPERKGPEGPGGKRPGPASDDKENGKGPGPGHGHDDRGNSRSERGNGLGLGTK